MQYFDHTDAVYEQTMASRRGVVSPIKVFDLSLLPNVIMHPTLKNVTFFMVEYARALQMDMLKYPKKYGNVSFKYVYEKMAKAIVNGDALVKQSVPIAHACRATGIPYANRWIQTYIWFDQQVPTRLMDLYLDRKKTKLASADTFRVPKLKRIIPRLAPGVE